MSNSNVAKVAFIGNPTSISWLLAQELISRGYDVDLVSNSSLFQTNKLAQQPSSPQKPTLLHRAIRKYCKPLYHATINNKDYDIELRAFSKPIVKARHRVMMYHGNDLRDHLWPVEYPCFYSTKELGLLYLDLAKQAVWLPRCVYAEIFQPEPRLSFDGKNIVIGHFPTDPHMEEKGLQGKGSKYLYAAIDILKERGYRVTLLTPAITGHVTHEEMPELYRQCHVIADQFIVGQYGVIAMEAILENRPVVCYVNDKYFEYLEMKDQIVNCEPTPESIADALLRAIDHKVDHEIVKNLYSPQRSADVLEKTLLSWGYLN